MFKMQFRPVLHNQESYFNFQVVSVAAFFNSYGSKEHTSTLSMSANLPGDTPAPSLWANFFNPTQISDGVEMKQQADLLG